MAPHSTLIGFVDHYFGSYSHFAQQHSCRFQSGCAVFQYNCHNLTSLQSFSEASYFMTVCFFYIKAILSPAHLYLHHELLLSWPSFAVSLMLKNLSPAFCVLHQW